MEDSETGSAAEGEDQPPALEDGVANPQPAANSGETSLGGRFGLVLSGSAQVRWPPELQKAMEVEPSQ